MHVTSFHRIYNAHAPKWLVLDILIKIIVFLCPDGAVIGSLHPTPCVSPLLLCEIHSWRHCGASGDDVSSGDDVIDRLRVRCVSTGYTPHPWSIYRHE